MAKLKLNINELRVEAFQTDETGPEKGTILGQQITAVTCTCRCTAASCAGTCDNSCYNTCMCTPLGTCYTNPCCQ